MGQSESREQFLESFPQALPGLPRMSAFGVRKASDCLNVDIGSRTWRVQKMDDHLQNLIRSIETDRIEGTISQINKVTLPPAAKVKAKIPEDATHYCWANPLNSTPESRRRMEQLSSDVTNDPTCSFILYGGFMYFRDQELVRCNSLKPGNDGLFFGPPQPFTSPNCRVSQNNMVADNCFSAITIPFFSAHGARFFAWVPPGTHAGGEITLPHGGFFYLFSEDMNEEDERDVYFKVLGTNDLEERMQVVNELLKNGQLNETDERETEDLQRLERQLEGEVDYIKAVLQQRRKKKRLESERMATY